VLRAEPRLAFGTVGTSGQTFSHQFARVTAGVEHYISDAPVPQVWRLVPVVEVSVNEGHVIGFGAVGGTSRSNKIAIAHATSSASASPLVRVRAQTNLVSTKRQAFVGLSFRGGGFGLNGGNDLCAQPSFHLRTLFRLHFHFGLRLHLSRELVLCDDSQHDQSQYQQ